MIDIHCHILPEVDDGPRDWETAAEMCRMAAADGIEHIVATPHSNDRYFYDREYLAELLLKLQSRVGESPRLSLGCDFHLSYDNLQAVLACPERYTVAGASYLLIELSNYSVPAQLEECFSQLGDKGITPIITHPERNPILQNSLPRVLAWVEQGCAIQVTGSALTGAWGERALRTARWLLEHHAVHVLATDAHGAKHRTPVLSAARDMAAQIASPEVAQALVEENPRAIISGSALPYFPDPVVK